MNVGEAEKESPQPHLSIVPGHMNTKRRVNAAAAIREVIFAARNFLMTAINDIVIIGLNTHYGNDAKMEGLLSSGHPFPQCCGSA